MGTYSGFAFDCYSHKFHVILREKENKEVWS